MHRSCLRYLCLILWLCSYAFAQELDELDRRLTHLEQLYASAHQQKGKDLVRRIHYEYEILYNLEVATQTLLVNLNTVKSYNLLAQVNNPTSDVLGFRFVDIMLANIDKRLVVPESERSRFKQLLSNIFNGFRTLGPAIAGASPTLSLFSTILGSVSNFFILEKQGNKVTDLTPAFQAEEIQAFTEDMRPYVSFYERMHQHNTQLQSSLVTLLKETEAIRLRTQSFAQRAEQAFGFSVNEASDARLESFLQRKVYRQGDSIDPKIIDASVELKAVADLVRELDELSRQFSQMVRQNLEENLTLVREASELPVFQEQQANPEKLKTLEAELATGRDLFNQPVVPHLTRMQELAVWLSAL